MLDERCGSCALCAPSDPPPTTSGPRSHLLTRGGGCPSGRFSGTSPHPTTPHPQTTDRAHPAPVCVNYSLEQTHSVRSVSREMQAVSAVRASGFRGGPGVGPSLGRCHSCTAREREPHGSIYISGEAASTMHGPGVGDGRNTNRSAKSRHRRLPDDIQRQGLQGRAGREAAHDGHLLRSKQGFGSAAKRVVRASVMI